jgi:hypothetical protein
LTDKEKDLGLPAVSVDWFIHFGKGIPLHLPWLLRYYGKRDVTLRTAGIWVSTALVPTGHQEIYLQSAPSWAAFLTCKTRAWMRCFSKFLIATRLFGFLRASVVHCQILKNLPLILHYLDSCYMPG